MLWRDVQRLWPAACALVLAAAVAALFVAASGAAARRRFSPAPLVRPLHAAAFRPVLGDWEGQFGAMHASFELERRGSGYMVENLVYQQPESCPANTDAPSSSFVYYGAPFAVGRDGAFPRGARTPLGALLSSQLAKLGAGYALHGCRGTLRIGMLPSPRRRRVEDGRWLLTASDGSDNTFVVRAGGRVAYGVALPPVTPTGCRLGVAPGSFSGELGLYIEPDGSADQTLTGSDISMTISMSFVSATTARGSYVVSSTDCTTRTLTFTARRLG